MYMMPPTPRYKTRYEIFMYLYVPRMLILTVIDCIYIIMNINVDIIFVFQAVIIIAGYNYCILCHAAAVYIVCHANKLILIWVKFGQT